MRNNFILIFLIFLVTKSYSQENNLGLRYVVKEKSEIRSAPTLDKDNVIKKLNTFDIIWEIQDFKNEEWLHVKEINSNTIGYVEKNKLAVEHLFKVNRKAFYSNFKQKVRSRGLDDYQKVGSEAIFDYWDSNLFLDFRWLAYILATAFYESSEHMRPVYEGAVYYNSKYYNNPFYTKNLHFRGGIDEKKSIEIARKLGKTGRAQHNYWEQDPITKQTYIGRGLCQLTLKDNYQKFSDLLGIDLVNEPDKAFELEISVKIMFLGMLKGKFREGHKLSKYFNEKKEDWYRARNIINGDKESKYGDIAKQLNNCLLRQKIFKFF